MTELKRKKILTVEDNDALRLSLKIALEAEGYEVVQTADGAEALELAASQRPDLILLDLFIPTLDGFAVLKQLKADGITVRVPVVIFSVLSNPDDKEKAMSDGAKDYLVKSEMTVAEVVKRVQQYF